MKEITVAHENKDLYNLLIYQIQLMEGKQGTQGLSDEQIKPLLRDAHLFRKNGRTYTKI